MSEEVVPPAKVIFLMAIGLMALIGLGGALGFQAFGQDFIENMNKYNLAEIGRGGRLVYYETPLGEKMVDVDIGFDLNTTYNSTHGVVYWFKGVELPYGATIIDAIQNIHSAKEAELRVYNLENSSIFERIPIDDFQSLEFTVTYGSISGMRYIDEINGIKNNPGLLLQWMIYFWNPEKGEFIYLTASPDKFTLSHRDTIIIIYDLFGGWPADCCSGGGWEYNEYEGALTR
ncbi:MAG: hypothetical protein ACQXXL_07395 [Candidatus Methanosuratincola sp.]|jgi:hypothetical protein|nr:hypothetical protein [Candidatus Methanosuratincola sp.]